MAHAGSGVAGLTTKHKHTSGAYSRSGLAPTPASGPAYVSGSAKMNTTVTNSVTVNAPAGIVAGNRLVAVVLGAGGSFTATGSWTQVATPANNLMCVWKRVAGGSEPGTYTFGWATNSVGGAIVLQYHPYGADDVDGAPAFSGATGVSTGSFASVTPTHATDTWVVVSASYFNGRALSGAGLAPFTARDTATWAGNGLMAAYDQALTTSAATGAASYTFTGGTDSYESASILLAP